MNRIRRGIWAGIGAAGIVGCASAPSKPIPMQAIAQALDARSSDSTACYDRYVGRAARQEGRVRVIFHVNSSGTATRVALIDSTFRNREFEKCLLQLVQRIRFPSAEPDTLYEVTYPFQFTQRL